MTTLKIPTPLRPYANGVSEIQVSSSKVGGALNELITQYPELRQHLYSEEGELRSFVNLFLNNEDVRYLQGTETDLKEGDSLLIIPSIAGGSVS